MRRLWVWEGLFFRDCTSLPPPEDSCPAVELEERLQTQREQLQALAQNQSLELRCAQLEEQNLLLRKCLNQVSLCRVASCSSIILPCTLLPLPCGAGRLVAALRHAPLV